MGFFWFYFLPTTAFSPDCSSPPRQRGVAWRKSSALIVTLVCQDSFLMEQVLVSTGNSAHPGWGQGHSPSPSPSCFGRQLLREFGAGWGASSFYPPALPLSGFSPKAAFPACLQLIHDTAACPGPPWRVPGAGGIVRTGVPSPPQLLPAPKSAARRVFQPRFPHRAASSTGAGEPRGRASPPAFPGFPHTFPASRFRARRIS